MDKIDCYLIGMGKTGERDNDGMDFDVDQHRFVYTLPVTGIVVRHTYTVIHI